MGNFLLPIFCFGVVITGIVLVGVQQASDLAKQLRSMDESNPLSVPPTGGATALPSNTANPLPPSNRP